MVNWVFDTDHGMVPDFEMEQRIRGVGGGDASVDFANTLRKGINFTAGAAGPGGAMGAPGPSAPGPGGPPQGRWGPSPNAGPNELRFWQQRYQQATSPNSAQAAMERLMLQEQLMRERLRMERRWKKEDTQSDRDYAEKQLQKRIQMINGIYGTGGGGGAPSTGGTRAPSPTSPQPAAPPAGPTGPTPGFTQAPSGGSLDAVRPDGIPGPQPMSQGAPAAPQAAPQAPQAQAVPQSSAVEQEMRQIDGEINNLRRQLRTGVALEDKSMIDASKSELSRLERRRNELMDQRKSQTAYEKKQEGLRAEWDESVRVRSKAFDGFMSHINALRKMPSEFRALGYDFDAAVGPMHTAPYGSEIVGTAISAVTPGYNEMRDAVKQRTAMIVETLKAIGREQGEGTLSDKDMEGFEKQAGDLLNASSVADYNRRLDRLLEGMVAKFQSKGVPVQLVRPGDTKPAGPGERAQAQDVEKQTLSTMEIGVTRYERFIAQNPERAQEAREDFIRKFGKPPEEISKRVKSIKGSSGLLPSIISPAEAAEPSWKPMPGLGGRQRDRDKQVMGR